ncbi:MAG TPA: protein kinase [Polyangiales bacterium]|nr:protein kinase [Polyangiales bacterium]
MSHASSLEERYETLRMLGQGGVGAVYLVRDRETGGLLALKKLLRLDPKSVLRLKREFRSLADVRHENLVQIYDLDATSDGWFLTMEYLDGTDLLTHLERPAGATNSVSLQPTRELQAPANDVERVDLELILEAFQQLANGIRALHQAGMLHRDLKPSNVMVTGKRVAVLDFGLVRGLDAEDGLLTRDGSIAGTPAYMAPEQAAGGDLGEPADWYAFGVMLYEALSGELPIEGRSATEIITRKTTTDAPPLRQIVSDLPLELTRLCDDLLARDPTKRPSGEQILKVLTQLRGQSATEVPLTLDQFHTTQAISRTRNAPPVVGRESELNQLTESLVDARTGQCVIARVTGTSGSGKTTLVQRFLAQIEDAPGYMMENPPLVLRNRCNEREAMPYKAIDGIVDSLVGFLLDLDDFTLGRLVPSDIPLLAQLFPTLQRIPSVRRTVETSRARLEGFEQRMRGERALREMLAKIASTRPLVLWFDDLQWGDLDSANILKAWPEQLASSAILLVYSYRVDEVATSPCLQELFSATPRTRQCEERVVDLSGLQPEAVRELCESRLGPLALQRPELVQRIASESQGSPYLVSQLATLAHAKFTRGDLVVDELSVEQLVDQSTNLLSAEAMRMLNVLAVAGRPVAQNLAVRAADVRGEPRGLLHGMRSLRLVRVRDTRGSRMLEVYHDRVREGVLASIDPAESIRTHAELLAALENTADVDPGWLHVLALGAAQPSAALRYGALAAERADSALAFERAIELYRGCIELASSTESEHLPFLQRLADCLSRAGHGERAAEAYLDLAKRMAPTEAVHYMRLAASHYIRSGEFERGDRIARDVLAALDIRVPGSDAALFAAIGWDHAALAIRGLEFTPRTEPPPPSTSATLELYVALSVEYQSFDPLLAAWFERRSLRAALASRDPYNIGRALCAAAIVKCVNGSPKAAQEADALLERAKALADAQDDQILHASVLTGRALCSFMLGRSQDILEPAYEAERLYRAKPGTGDYYHRFVVVAVRIGALISAGQYLRAATELADARAEAIATHNQCALLQLTLDQTALDGVFNQLESAKQRLLEERALLPNQRFGPYHTLHMISVMRVACGTHDYAWADAWLEEAWARWEKSLVHRSAYLNVLAYGARLRYLVNRHVVEARTEDIEAVVRGPLKMAARSPFAEGRVVLATRTRARLAYLAGRGQEAVELMKTAVEALGSAAPGEEARERCALGHMIGGNEGAAIVSVYEQRLRELGFVDPLSEMWSGYPELKGSDR